MQLVLLAAGHGRRFGGLKQLAPVGPDGEALIDYTALAAAEGGFDAAVLVVRAEIYADVAAHLRRHWPKSLPFEFILQHGARGTAHALLAARPAISGPIALANADDLYTLAALAALREALALEAGPQGEGRHLLVGYHLDRTVLSGEAVSRGLCEITASGELLGLHEHGITRRGDGSYNARRLNEEHSTRRLEGREWVSMNLWGFLPTLFPELEAAVARAAPERAEVLLPEVIDDLLRNQRVRVALIETEEHCIGLTHRADLALVRTALAGASPGELVRALRGP